MNGELIHLSGTRTSDIEILDQSTVLTLGSFDGIHLGHQFLLKEVLELRSSMESDTTRNESLVIQFDPHPREVLRGEQVARLCSRKESEDSLRELGFDWLYILPFSKELAGKTATEFVEDILLNKLKMAAMVLGYDHSFGKNRDANDVLMEKLSEQHAFQFKRQSAFELKGDILSSTLIRALVRDGDVESARKALGRPYQLRGIVVEGAKRGRTIGFPTANLRIDDKRKLLPKNGVYLVKGSSVEGFDAYGMLNIGVRPTVSDSENISIETYFFDTDKDLYGQNLKLELLLRHRDEKKFDSLEELKNQLYRDKADCLNYLKSLS